MRRREPAGGPPPGEEAAWTAVGATSGMNIANMLLYGV